MTDPRVAKLAEALARVPERCIGMHRGECTGACVTAPDYNGLAIAALAHLDAERRLHASASEIGATAGLAGWIEMTRENETLRAAVGGLETALRDVLDSLHDLIVRVRALLRDQA